MFRFFKKDHYEKKLKKYKKSPSGSFLKLGGGVGIWDFLKEFRVIRAISFLSYFKNIRPDKNDIIARVIYNH
jgi:hypothetical protein